MTIFWSRSLKGVHGTWKTPGFAFLAPLLVELQPTFGVIFAEGGVPYTRPSRIYVGLRLGLRPVRRRFYVSISLGSRVRFSWDPYRISTERFPDSYRVSYPSRMRAPLALLGACFGRSERPSARPCVKVHLGLAPLSLIHISEPTSLGMI